MPLITGSSSPAFTPGNLRSQTARPPAVTWDKQIPVKTVGMATSVSSSQVSPALVNALFERVEEQAEVRNVYCSFRGPKAQCSYKEK